MNKTTSCGVIITDGTRLVMGHITGGKNWDIPKGGMDPNESFLQAAVRELREETGLEVDPTVLSPLGHFDYKPKKDLMLYLWRVDTLPDPQTLHCQSTWKNRRGQNMPELDSFALVTWDETSTRANPDLARVLQRVQGMIS